MLPTSLSSLVELVPFESVKMFQFTNIYVLAAFGTIGGALFGFDISSMSAWIGTDQYTNYFNSPDSDLQGGITV